MPLTEIKKLVEGGQFVPYEIKEYALDSARTNEPITVEGDHLAAQVSSGATLAGVTIRFNMLTAGAVPIEFFNPWKQQFFKLFLTHTAQAGKKLYLAIGREQSSQASSYVQSKELFVPLEKALIHGTTELADTDILGADLSPTNTPCLFRTMVMLETAGIFSAMLKNAASTKKMQMNTGVALVVDSGYMFDILVHSGDTVNFQTSVGGDVTMRVQEIIGGVQ